MDGTWHIHQIIVCRLQGESSLFIKYWSVKSTLKFSLEIFNRFNRNTYECRIYVITLTHTHTSEYISNNPSGWYHWMIVTKKRIFCRLSCGYYNLSVTKVTDCVRFRLWVFCYLTDSRSLPVWHSDRILWLWCQIWIFVSFFVKKQTFFHVDLWIEVNYSTGFNR